jgi:hypothetical protein
MASIICWLEQHDKLSGWAQTVGALVAIIVTICIFMYQNRQFRRQRNADKVTLLNGVLGILEDAERALNSVSSRWEASRNPVSENFMSERERLLQALSALNEIPMHLIQPYAALAAFLACKKLINEAVAKISSRTIIEMENRRVNHAQEFSEQFATQRAIVKASAHQLSH